MKTCSKCAGPVEPTYAKYGRVCKKCRFATAKKYRDRKPEKHRAAARRHAAKHPDARRVRAWRAQGINMTTERFNAMLAEQGGRCAICRSDDPRDQNWHVDHDHQFGHVRGLLCRPCNNALGCLLDSPALFRAALRYLLKHQPQLNLKAS